MINATQRRVKRQVFSLMFDLPELRLPNKKSVEAMGSGLHRCLPDCPPVVFWMSEMCGGLGCGLQVCTTKGWANPAPSARLLHFPPKY